MDFFAILLIAAGLAMDCFAVSLGIGTTRALISFRSVFRVSFHFGLFQGLMTFLGWLSGTTIAAMISQIDHWIAAGLLAAVGIHMIVEGFKPKCEEEAPKKDPSRGGSLVLLSVATSIDAMAVGLSMAMLQVDIFTSSLMIGLVSAAFSLAGIFLGTRLGVCFGQRMEILGGLILNGIGLRILYTHLFI
jgi:putative Mn2+ efflux pump MntP